MMRRAKIAISIDARQLARVERIRAITGETRSAIIGRALAQLASESAHDQHVQEYLQAYRRHPEEARAVEAARQHVRKSLARLPWDDT
jgi:hypothetical protein